MNEIFPNSHRVAVRVSGGHLCGAEAPTEPVGENRIHIHRDEVERRRCRGNICIQSKYGKR